MTTRTRPIVLAKTAERKPKPPPLASLSLSYAIGYQLGWEYRQMGGTDLLGALGSCSSDPQERAGFRAAFEDLEGLT
jgi:hypothetical protein